MIPTAARWALAAAGILCVALGTIGIFLPLLPTTPFLLLAAVCFAESSARLHRWLLTNRLFGSYVSGYVKGTGIPLRVKVMTIALLWGTITYAAFWVVEMLAVRIILMLIATAVTVHLIMVKTARPGGDAAHSEADAPVGDPEEPPEGAPTPGED